MSLPRASGHEDEDPIDEPVRVSLADVLGVGRHRRGSDLAGPVPRVPVRATEDRARQALMGDGIVAVLEGDVTPRRSDRRHAVRTPRGWHDRVAVSYTHLTLPTS